MDIGALTTLAHSLQRQDSLQYRVRRKQSQYLTCIHTEYSIIYRISGAVQYIYYLQATTITTVLSTTTLTSIKLLQYSTVAHLHLQAATALAVAADGLCGARAGRHCRGELLQRISE